MTDFPQPETEKDLTRPPVKLSKRSIEMVATSLDCDYKVTVLQNNGGSWVITVQFDDSSRQVVIETARGKVKVWRSLESAILFVMLNFNFATEVSVEIEQWKFQRVRTN